ncbi:CDP-glycerol glycerophosphotransferase family protein [Aeromonas cavernicola]|uniref:Glycosyltransferase 2-like domain-containing protein n=1 Tax=Aeromonas cavernicola TaxID=1006623 RepID=A0A2H9U301_9GAMM|nr:CDP-glycerol glycerophosphotransferase family protein [Aeromonas cavernicola]PJG58403.1 hypothetical protein CUC53_12785 [Aeromonas cavernicola]
MLNRKFRKLFNNPKLFLSDMAIKHSNKISYFKPKNMEGHYQYTVISAVYNVGHYLDDYFESLVKQRLDFKKHIQLILVDDGSTDNSADIIRRWQKKYPKNIMYLYKENGGQASARNAGITHANTEWITFIDPDDFMDYDYFSEVDKSIYKNKDAALVCCNMIFYMEDKKIYSDGHALNYKFKDCNSHHSISDDPHGIQLSAPSAFFRNDIVKSNSIIFNQNIKPSFEDGEFVLRYKAHSCGMMVLNLKTAKYYYRRRSDNSSTVNTAWTKKEQYNNVLLYGFISSLKFYQEKFGYIPEFVQKTILYHLSWYFMLYSGSARGIPILDDVEQDNTHNLITETLSYIDSHIIWKCKTPGFNYYYRLGVTNLSAAKKPHFDVVYIDEIDQNKKIIRINFYHLESEPFIDISLNEVSIQPISIKIKDHLFLHKSFIKQQIILIKYESDQDELAFATLSSSTTISMAGQDFKKIAISEAIKLTSPAKKSLDSEAKTLLYVSKETSIKRRYNNAWLFIDRISKASDNAEALYRFCKEKNENCFFIINKNCDDWNRLESDGFNLIEYGSDEHKMALLNAKYLISSHTEISLLSKKIFGEHLKYKFIFLQHGITLNDASDWLNKERIDLFITATLAEHNSITSQNNNYKYSNANTVLCGFPRHDCLVKNHDSKKIVIVPTWRSYLTGGVDKTTGLRNENDNFANSEFYIKWNELLNSVEFHSICEEKKCDVYFLLHPNMNQYKDFFTSNLEIKVLDPLTTNYSELISNTSLLITDYSSIAFDMAVLETPVIYYQFDYERVYSGAHTISKGYFDFITNGFGPVVYEKPEVIKQMKYIIDRNFLLENVYLSRIVDTFPYRDNNNSKRVYNAIYGKMEFVDTEKITDDSLFIHANNASISQKWNFAEKRWANIKSLSSNPSNEVCLKLVESIRNQGHLSKAEDLYKSIKNESSLNTYDFIREAALLSICRHKWSEAIVNFKRLPYFNDLDFILCSKAYSELKWNSEIVEHLKQIKKLYDINHNVYKICKAYYYISINSFQDALDLLQVEFKHATEKELRRFKPQLMMAKCLRELNRLDDAAQFLVNYEKHTRNDPICREEISQLAYARGNYDKVIKQIDLAYKNHKDLPESLAIIMIKSFQNKINDIATTQYYSNNDDVILLRIKYLREHGNIAQAKALLEQYFMSKNRSEWTDSVYFEAAGVAMASHDWQLAITHWDCLKLHDGISGMARIRCLAELGRSKAIKRVLIDASWLSDLSTAQKNFAHALYHVATRDWDSAIHLLQMAIPVYEKLEFLVHKPQLWLSRCFREKGLLIDAGLQLESYEKHTRNDPECRIQIAKLALAKKNFKKTILQIERAFPDTLNTPDDIAAIMIYALNQLQLFEKSAQFMRSIPENKFSSVAKHVEIIIKTLNGIPSKSVAA